MAITEAGMRLHDRVIDVFPAAEKDMIRTMLSESLRAVISQNLLKKKGGTQQLKKIMNFFI